MTEHGEVRISAAMTLEKFREGLERLMPTPEARPFTCKGSPFKCRLFIVGFNPATPLKQDFFRRYWCDDRGFLRKVFEADYLQRRKEQRREEPHKRQVSPTRQRIEAFVEGASPVPCLETNIYAVPTAKASELESKYKNMDIIEYLIKKIRPAGIFVHSNAARKLFQKLSGCKPGDEPKRVEMFERPTWLLGGPPPPLRMTNWRINCAEKAGTKMKCCVERQRS